MNTRERILKIPSRWTIDSSQKLQINFEPRTTWVHIIKWLDEAFKNFS